MTTPGIGYSKYQMMAITFRVSLILGLSCGTFGQTTVKPADYSQEALVVEDSANEIVFANDGTGERTSFMRVRLQSAAGIQAFGVLAFPYQKSSETVDIDYVRVHKPDGTIISTPVDDPQDLDSEITREAPLYSDSRQKQLAVKGLGVGDVLEYSAHWHVKKPLVPGQFWETFSFSHAQIILHDSLRVSVPAGRPVKWKSEGLTPVITEAHGLRVFTWTHAQLAHPSAEEEKKDKARVAYRTSVGKLPQPEIQVSSFLSWEEVGKWYTGLQEDRVKPTAEVRAKALQLTKGMTQDEAKIRAIYQYVSTEFRYIGVDFGIGRYQPHAAGDVLSNQYGDCKDKHTLLASLLSAVGITAYPALLNSAHDIDKDVPSPAQFDHVITVVPQPDGLTWLDSTPEVAPFGYLFSSYRNKSALIMPPGKAASLTMTPAQSPVPSLETFRIDAKLNESLTLDGKIQRTLQGSDGEVLLRLAFRRTPSQKWKELAQQFSFFSGFAGEVSDVTANSGEKPTQPFKLEFHYTRKDYPAKQQMLLPFPPLSLAAVPEGDEKPEYPIRLGGPAEIRYEAHVELPKGERASLPAKVDLAEAFGEYHATYSFKDAVLTAERSLVMKTDELTPASYSAYRKFTKELRANQELTIPLSSGKSFLLTYQEDIWRLPGSKNEAALKEYADAQEAVKSKDRVRMIASLQRAVELDPSYTRAWLWLGETYKSSGQGTQAIEAYRSALRTNAESAVSYKALAFTLSDLGKFEDALTAAKDLTRVAPDDATGPYVMGTALRKLKRCEEAAEAFETAAGLEPDESSIQLEVGGARLCAGQLEKGLATFRKALEQDPTAETLNGVAYRLAEKNVGLDEALKYATKAVEEQTADSRKVNLASLELKDTQLTSHLAADWDTLGWVYFRQGNYALAKEYLKAAWVLSERPAGADHLGQVYAVQNDKQEAVHLYRLALKRTPKTSPLAAQTRERLEKLVPGSSTIDHKTDIALESEITQMRTAKLSGLPTHNETAEFFLLFARDPKTRSAKVEDVKYISGAPELKAAVDLIKSADFHVVIPSESGAKLVRRALLGCFGLSGCSITLLVPGDVRSVN